MGLVKGVDFVTVFTADLERARTFYGETLGLEAGPVYQGGEGPPVGAEFETGNLTISVMSSAAIGREFKPSGHPIAFQVDDVAAARAELEGKGVQFDADTIDSGVCHMGPFSDPDGNALMLHQRYAPRS